ncbi:MAG: class I SAM-dependent methyltransferase [Candidatus Omnitrophota bacterium]
MRASEDKNLDNLTKKAWEKNWQDIAVAQIMEIFKYPRVQRKVEVFRQYFPTGKKILEGGCGLGAYLIYFRDLNYDVIGLDYNFTPLAEILTYKPHTPVICGDVANMPFLSGSFGCYLSLGVIEHFSAGPQKAIKEAYRVLERGGYFILTVPRLSIFHKLKQPLMLLKKLKWLRKLLNKKSTNHYWEQYFKITELAGVIKKNNFKIVKIIAADQEHSLVAFSPVFRDKKSLDGANRLGVSLAMFLQRHMPWSTSADTTIICRKEK